jgi:polysaccharide export outer membrane protein
MRSTVLFAAVTLALALPCHAQDKQAETKTTEPHMQAMVESSNTPTNTPAPPTEDISANYLIGPSDSLTVTVWKEIAMSGTFLVRPDGKISMALLGDVQAAGLSPLQLGDEIKGKLKKFIQDPNVTVRIDQIHSKIVYLLGEVGKKGPLEMTPGMTLLQAISSAGGVTEYANKKKMYILRTEGGKQSKIPVHYKEALKGDESFNVVLKPSDTIVVP